MSIQKELIKLLKDKVKPAIGCTEPIAVALAVAEAKSKLEGKINKVEVTVSSNIYKNGMHVAIPGTTEVGLSFAAALSLVAGNANLGLEVLRDNTSKDIKKAEELVDLINIESSSNVPQVYVYAVVYSETDWAAVTIEGLHDNITKIEVNDEVEYEDIVSCDESKDSFDITNLTLQELRQNIEQISVEELDFLLNGAEMNKKMAEIGLKESPGLGIGSGLQKLIEEGKINDDLSSQVRMMSAAAVDARMGGIKSPVMSSSGSGNHGITAIVPPTVVAEYYQLSKEKLIKALAISHLVTSYVKEFTGTLSPVCGCSIAAASGASAGITWLLEGNDEQIAGAVQNMIGNLTGMICDGAKYDCALKIATSACEAVTSAQLAINGNLISNCNGIVNSNVETSIQNLETICVDGMKNMDNKIIEVMLSHCNVS
ncbi:serine dehydratase subunit alpha family protein [Sporohalobacter salinus]|uniref:L-cysteine desulfidase family protein n=1 Tax=Sporohalobacter salinus TaxID=1494606 RepID=UPI001960FAFD|nr:L-serine ammonia-lyase, iron-sulfur-dependent, subunit alpha [Sporohalobacter salinus]MBM7624234.1 L-cysteine desulfidase [Sporohalobacter salinus]